jgi:hypothetical protein
MKIYRVIEEDDQFVTYEFRTIYIYVLYVVLAIMLTGFWTNQTWLSVVGGSLMALYFFTVSLPYMPLHRKIRKAMREGSVTFSGSKWSFGNPLTIKLKKDVPTTKSTLSSEGAPSDER